LGARVSRYRDSKTGPPDNVSEHRYLGSRYRDLTPETQTMCWAPLSRVSGPGLEDGGTGLGFMVPGLRSSARDQVELPRFRGHIAPFL
jgi:hypothetical protein